MPAYDSLLMFRTSTAAITASESSAALTIRGTGRLGLAARVTVPGAGAETILPKYYHSDDGSTYTLFAQYPDGAVSIPTGGKSLITHLVTDKKYVKEELVVAGTTPANLGAIKSGLVTGVPFDWVREESFE